MEVSLIIDGINARKAAMNMTNQQVADESGVPKSTVDRVLRKDTENPSVQVVLAIADAVGYEFGIPAAAQAPEVVLENPHFRHIITMYEKQIADLRRDQNRERTEKNRWIKILALIVGIMGAGIIAILLIDILSPSVGWFQREVSMQEVKYYETAMLAMKDFLHRIGV